MPNCPICNKPLQDGESFRMEYFAPRNWWVFYHVRDVEEREIVPDSNDSYDNAVTIERYKGWCAQANVSISDPIPFQLRGTDWISF